VRRHNHQDRQAAQAVKLRDPRGPLCGVRYVRSLTIYGTFFHIACFMIVLRKIVQ
jgi:hypothetical protein